jgi:hypothetical protein
MKISYSGISSVKKIKDRISALKLSYSDALLHICKYFVQSIVFEYIVLREQRYVIYERNKQSGQIDSMVKYGDSLTFPEIPHDLKFRKYRYKFKNYFLEFTYMLSPNNIQLYKSHNQTLYIRPLRLNQFLPSAYQSEFSDFELASLISFRLIKNLTKEAAYPFDPRFVHLLFFPDSVMYPTSFTLS